MSSADGPLVCLECGTNVWDFSAHYPTHVHCLLCPYSSCCSRAYASHMIQHHLPHSKDKVLPLHRRPPPCVFMLRCSHCDYSPQTGDQMANHLLQTNHYSATCCTFTYVELDLKFCLSEEQQLLCDQEPEQNQDLQDSSWRSADSWKDPAELADTQLSVLPFTQTSGPNHNLPKNGDAIDFFNLLFPATLVELIAKETNGHVKTCSFLGCSTPGWIPVTTFEVKGFLGLVILMGIQNLPDPSQYWSLNHYDNSYTFYRTMSFKRFKQIADNIRMGSFITSEYCGTANPTDPLHIFRPMMELLGGSMWNSYQPNCCLTIDRALLPSMEEDWCQSKGKAQTQPQVWLLCDSKSGYCHRLFFQAAEKGSQDLGFSVVPRLVKDLENKHHQVYLTNSLASVPLMQRLLQQGIYASSSFPPHNPILPRELWECGRLEKPGDFVQRQCGPLLATRWMDTKEMGCLTTNAAAGEPDVVWRRSQAKPGGLAPINRPMAFRLLQENMRGVDICKQLLACNPLGGIVQDRHWRSFFWFLVNLSIVNAFIVLRESRKENPPTWVQDGLFTQVNFRRRLGNQLAKCAQKYFDSMEMSSPRRTVVEVPEEPVKQRHRMSKISNISKRCKNCNLKNLRCESFYGCVACKASLCNEPVCFWEYHGLSPLNKGSTKVGFLRDSVSGAVDVDEGAEDLDQAMAPVEDLDYSDDEKLDELQDVNKTQMLKETSVSKETPSVCPSPSGTASKDQEDFLSARQLRVVLYALCNGLQPACRVFSTEPPLIRSWLKEAKRRMRQTEQKAASRGSERMVAWVMTMREQQLPISEGALFHKASTLKTKGAFSDSFRISYDWAVNFLLQHQLGVHRMGVTAMLAHPLPPFLEAKVTSFKEFTQRVVRVHNLPETRVAAMDELCLFVDWQLAQDRNRSSEALEFTGSVPVVTVFLTVLADGTTLPSLLLTSRPLPRQVLPESVLLEACPEGVSTEDALDLWTNKVWLPHVFGEPGKSVLVLDRHREHLGDLFLTSTAGCLSLLAVIPGGCSWSLQPVEVCLKPALQRLLLSRWTAFTARNPPQLQQASPNKLQTDVIQLLVGWLMEALEHLKKLPQIWRKSFDLTGLLPPPRGEPEDPPSKPEQVQADLLRALMEEFLGEENSSEVQESDQESDESQQGQEGQEEGKNGGMEEETTDKQKEQSVKCEEEEQGHVRTDNRGGQEEEEGKVKREKEEKGDTKSGEEEEKKKEAENREQEMERITAEVDGKEEEEKEAEAEEEWGEVNKERRETRIVIGEEVGDEWKITVKSRAEGADEEEERRDGR